MKKALLLLGLIFTAAAANAADFELGYSSWAVVGVKVTSGTAKQINAVRPTGFGAKVTGFRVQNQDPTYAVWIGYTSSVSTGPAVNAALAPNLGLQLVAGADAPFQLGNQQLAQNQPVVPLWVKAADGAGANGVHLSVEWFGY